MIIYRIFLQIKDRLGGVRHIHVVLVLWVLCVGIYAYFAGIQRASPQGRLGSVVRHQTQPKVQANTISTSTMPIKSVQIGAFVASKSGTKYYQSGCAATNRIKSENRVYFASEGEAKAAGYGKAQTC